MRGALCGSGGVVAERKPKRTVRGAVAGGAVGFHEIDADKDGGKAVGVMEDRNQIGSIVAAVVIRHINGTVNNWNSLEIARVLRKTDLEPHLSCGQE
ncbi:hypothetical protein P7K49_011468 [Saguinus oedipus]|uniref:Uncharacterized protein n=1 Tax=Saguinus oedipus TaxID=9490 RepID=A0ABQ9VQR0_SAGOE|nr:hypothetical protein P7K49_011468 [Saguinus oedipus]